LSLALSIVFALLALAEAKFSGVADALVMVVISLTYFRGWMVGRKSGGEDGKGYALAATLLAVSFAIIQVLSMLACFVDSVMTGEVCVKPTPSMFGLLLLPQMYRQIRLFSIV
jgi:hypothetical protein